LFLIVFLGALSFLKPFILLIFVGICYIAYSLIRNRNIEYIDRGAKP
jgi:hypothetical protein